MANPVGAKRQLSPQERAILFSQATRKYVQRLQSMTFAEGQTLNLQLPKTRFLSKILLIVDGSFKAAHASKTTFTKSVFDKYNILKQIRLQINNGFTPYQLSGSMLKVYNMVNDFKNVGLAADPFGVDVLGNSVSAAGASNNIHFVLELPITINDRDSVGLILLQNEATSVNISLDCDMLTKLMTDTDITTSNANITITPVIETFSVPSLPDAIPDYSILKVVNQQADNIVANGEMTIKLPTSLTYRKLFVYLASDTAMTPIDPSNIASFQLVFNQADSPINVPADYLEYVNRRDYAGQLPKGCYCLDFSTAGLANLAGARDYVDTERLTEFWLKINLSGISGNTNYVYTVSEKLARML